MVAVLPVGRVVVRVAILATVFLAVGGPVLLRLPTVCHGCQPGGGARSPARRVEGPEGRWVENSEVTKGEFRNKNQLEERSFQKQPAGGRRHQKVGGRSGSAFCLNGRRLDAARTHTHTNRQEQNEQQRQHLVWKPVCMCHHQAVKGS